MITIILEILAKKIEEIEHFFFFGTNNECVFLKENYKKIQIRVTT